MNTKDKKENRIDLNLLITQKKKKSITVYICVSCIFAALGDKVIAETICSGSGHNATRRGVFLFARPHHKRIMKEPMRHLCGICMH